MSEQNHHAHFDDVLTAVVIEQLTVHDKDVAREAQRWTGGEPRLLCRMVVWPS
jgi:hypothetical protein